LYYAADETEQFLAASLVGDNVTSNPMTSGYVSAPLMTELCESVVDDSLMDAADDSRSVQSACWRRISEFNDQYDRDQSTTVKV